jgi:uncharacterized glyoxalase superfamily protein PhnB
MSRTKSGAAANKIRIATTHVIMSSMTIRAITPLLRSTDVARAIDFYTKVLRFTLGGVQRRPDGTPFYCYLTAPGSDAAVMFATGEGNAAPSMTGSLYMYSNDVRALWEELREKVTVEYPLRRFFYDMAEFGFRDPHGYLLRFGQDVSEVTDAENIPVYSE